MTATSKADSAPKRPDHRPPLTLAQQLAKGPRFQGEPGLCVACGEPGPVDKATKLDKPCWRAWRFGPRVEREMPEFNPGAAR